MKFIGGDVAKEGYKILRSSCVRQVFYFVHGRTPKERIPIGKISGLQAWLHRRYVGLGMRGCKVKLGSDGVPDWNSHGVWNVSVNGQDLVVRHVSGAEKNVAANLVPTFRDGAVLVSNFMGHDSHLRSADGSVRLTLPAVFRADGVLPVLVDDGMGCAEMVSEARPPEPVQKPIVSPVPSVCAANGEGASVACVVNGGVSPIVGDGTPTGYDAGDDVSPAVWLGVE